MRTLLLNAADAVNRAQALAGQETVRPADCAHMDGLIERAIGNLASARALTVIQSGNCTIVRDELAAFFFDKATKGGAS